MAITAQQKANLLGVTSFMFNFAPDQASYARFEARIEANPSFYALGTDLARTEAYTSQFAEGATRAEKIDLILGRLGLTEGEGYERGVNFINQRLDAGIPEGQVLMEIGEKLLQDTPPTGLEDAAAILKNKMAASEAYLESGIEGYSSETLPDLLANITADAASVEEAQAAIDAVANEGETVSLTAAGDDRLFGTENNDTFTAEAGTLQAGDQLLDQSTSDNDTLNAVITNANKGGIAPTLLNIENVNLDLDVFSGAQFSAANTEGATITASSTKQGFNGGFSVSGLGDNTVVAGENVTELAVTGLEGGVVDTGAAESATVDMAAGEEVANVTVNGDIALGVDTADVLNLTATADTTVTLTDVVGTGAVSVTEIVGSGEGAITVQGDLGAVTDITGVDTAVVTTNANASDWDVNTISIADDVAALTVADAANVAIAEEQTGLTITGQSNTGSTVNVTSGLTAIGTLAFAGTTLASAELELSAANVEVASLTANDVALTVNVTDGAEFAVLAGDDISLVGSGNAVVENADAVGTLDASGLDGELELTTTAANAAGIEVNGAVGNNTVEFANSGETNFVGQAGNDQVTFSAAFADEATIITNAGDDTVTLKADITGTMAINFGEGNDTLEVANGVDLSDGTISLVGLENVVIATSATFAAEQLSGAEYSVAGDAGQAAFIVEGTANSSSIDLSGLDLNRTIDTGITGVTVDLTAGGTTVTGTSVADTIQGIDVTADYTLTLGGGADAVHSLTAGAGSVTITDFDADNDGLFSDAGTTALAADIEFGSITTAQAATFNDAATLAFANGGTAALVNQVVSFEYDGSAYIVINDGTNAGFSAADDLVIELQGITETEVAAIA